jgi:hypothetical protein
MVACFMGGLARIIKGLDLGLGGIIHGGRCHGCRDLLHQSRALAGEGRGGKGHGKGGCEYKFLHVSFSVIWWFGLQ